MELKPKKFKKAFLQREETVQIAKKTIKKILVAKDRFVYEP